jgi:hypothetical protein
MPGELSVLKAIREAVQKHLEPLPGHEACNKLALAALGLAEELLKQTERLEIEVMVLRARLARD